MILQIDASSFPTSRVYLHPPTHAFEHCQEKAAIKPISYGYVNHLLIVGRFWACAIDSTTTQERPLCLSVLATSATPLPPNLFRFAATGVSVSEPGRMCATTTVAGLVKS